MTDPVPGDDNYDPIVHGMPVNVLAGAGGLGDSIAANTTALGTLTTAINSLKSSVDALTTAVGLLKTAVEANTAAEAGEGT